MYNNPHVCKSWSWNRSNHDFMHATQNLTPTALVFAFSPSQFSVLPLFPPTLALSPGSLFLFEWAESLMGWGYSYPFSSLSVGECGLCQGPWSLHLDDERNRHILMWLLSTGSLCLSQYNNMQDIYRGRDVAIVGQAGKSLWFYTTKNRVWRV